MAVDVAVCADKRTPRLQYTLRFVFSELLNWTWALYTDGPSFADSEASFRINYSKEDVPCDVRMGVNGLLSETELFEQNLRMSDWEGLPIFFAASSISDIPFDAFSATFYCLSRYEEYLPFVADEHDRFPAEQSVAFQEGFLSRPLVNEWWARILVKWKSINPGLEDRRGPYRLLSTIDVDNSFAFRGKHPLRLAYGAIQELASGRSEEFAKRWATLFRGATDPLDTYDRDMAFADELEIELLYFVLFSEWGPNDRNISPHSQMLQRSIRHISDFASLGAHPSYRTSKEPDVLNKEKAGLQALTKQKLEKSRQHFLRFRLPSTYRQLRAAGIKQEHSMGYSTQTGWRASCCVPFFFYDLEMEEETDLKIFPFAFMDSVYQDHLKKSAGQALTEMKMYAEQAKRLEGTFVSVMHQRNMGDLWPGSEKWRSAYEELMHFAR